MSNSISGASSALLIAKSILPRTLANRLPLVIGKGDGIIYDGFDRHDFPRYGGDVQYSIGVDAKLKCIGWSYGRYDGDRFVKSRNPLGKIHYIFEGEFIDNSTFKPHTEKDEVDDRRMIIPFSEDLDDTETLCRNELELPDDADLRETLEYPDRDDIERRDRLAFELASFATSRAPVGGNTHEGYEYTDTYEDENGTYQTVNAKVAVDEEILIERILKVDKSRSDDESHEPQINYYWTLTRSNEESEIKNSIVSRKAA